MDRMAVPAILQAWAGLPYESARELVPKLQYNPGQRTGAGKWHVRTLWQHRNPQRNRPVAAEDYELRRRTPGLLSHSMPPEHPPHPPQLDWTQHGTRDPL